MHIKHQQTQQLDEYIQDPVTRASPRSPSERMSAASSRSGTPVPNQSRSSPRTSSKSPSSRATDAPSFGNYFSYPVSRVVSGLYRRLTDPPAGSSSNGNNDGPDHRDTTLSSNIYTPKRTASPFQPPPLTPLTLSATGINSSQPILTRALAEEIRLLVPPRLQLVDTWRLAYSLERDGSSLATLYETCRRVSERSPRAGYVLVLRDNSAGGTLFGAYLTDPPHPAPHFYGTGECFLWRASVLPSTPVVWPQNQSQNTSKSDASQDEREGSSSTQDDRPPLMTEEELRRAGLPPPPSADTSNAARSTTLRAATPPASRLKQQSQPDLTSSTTTTSTATTTTTTTSNSTSASTPVSGTTTPERIRFKAFPYSGVNDYMIFCESGYLSVGGGCVVPFPFFILQANACYRDGHYGLWIDDSVEKGVSSSCPTFGNENLSDEGEKFDILGAEVWYIGA